MFKRIFPQVAILALILLVGLAGCSTTKETVGQVNGEAITKKEFEQRVSDLQRMYEQQYGIKFEDESGQKLMDSLKEMVLDQLVAEKLLLQEAKKQGLKVKDQEVKDRLNQDKQMVGGEQEFQKILKEELKISEREYKKYLADQLLIEKLYDQVIADVKVDESEVKNYYDQNKGLFVTPEQWHVRHILLPTKEEAEQVIKDLKGGADFAKLASEKSTDPTAKENQGDLGYIDEDTNFVPEFKQAAFALKAGEFTIQPVKTDYGFHVIKVEDRRPARQQTYEEAKNQIESELTRQKQTEKFHRFVEELKQKANIVKSGDSQPAQPASAPSEGPGAEGQKN
ncbi:MAG: hypothetical protein HPY81_05530 [Firmicutes bacterium]|nr:hypothetical protein [Bacillota bacterium]